VTADVFLAAECLRSGHLKKREFEADVRGLFVSVRVCVSETVTLLAVSVEPVDSFIECQRQLIGKIDADSLCARQRTYGSLEIRCDRRRVCRKLSGSNAGGGAYILTRSLRNTRWRGGRSNSRRRGLIRSRAGDLQILLCRIRRLVLPRPGDLQILLRRIGRLRRSGLLRSSLSVLISHPYAIRYGD